MDRIFRFAAHSDPAYRRFTDERNNEGGAVRLGVCDGRNCAVTIPSSWEGDGDSRSGAAR